MKIRQLTKNERWILTDIFIDLNTLLLELSNSITYFNTQCELQKFNDKQAEECYLKLYEEKCDSLVYSLKQENEKFINSIFKSTTGFSIEFPRNTYKKSLFNTIGELIDELNKISISNECYYKLEIIYNKLKETVDTYEENVG